MKWCQYILITLLTFGALTARADTFLIQVLLTNTTKEGYGVEMYYVSNNLKEIHTNIQKIKILSEREILAAFGTPLTEPGNSLEECEEKDMLHIQNNQLFKKQPNYLAKAGTLKISISVRCIDIDYCVFPLNVKYWNSYDVAFTQAAVIIRRGKSCKLSVLDKTIIQEIIYALEANTAN